MVKIRENPLKNLTQIDGCPLRIGGISLPINVLFNKLD